MKASDLSVVTRLTQATAKVIKDPVYLKNIEYGKPRDGHPEGTLKAHIEELLTNVAKLDEGVDDWMLQRLVFLVHVHDTFKANALSGSPITHPQSHASLAVAYAKQHTEDRGILNTLQFHDLNWAMWQKAKKMGGMLSIGQRREIEELVALLNYDLPLYLLFTLVDGCVPGKEGDKAFWFIGQVNASLPEAFRITKERFPWLKAFSDYDPTWVEE